MSDPLQDDPFKVAPADEALLLTNEIADFEPAMPDHPEYWKGVFAQWKKRAQSIKAAVLS